MYAPKYIPLRAPKPQNFVGQKRHEPDAVYVSRHELSHVDAGGIAVVARRIERSVYDRITAVTDCEATEGFVAFVFPDGTLESVKSEVLQLSAFGPIADVEHIAEYAEDGRFDELVELSGMSDIDKSHAFAWSGPPQLPLTVCLSVAHLREKLGKGAMQLRAKCLRDITNQHLDDLLLKDILPYDEAVAAYEVGRTKLKTLRMR
ncbi:hypothetical protein LCM28_05610 [Salipiger pacificus]|nr:hypothetical protein [Alloyangia pacifica]